MPSAPLPSSLTMQLVKRPSQLANKLTSIRRQQEDLLQQHRKELPQRRLPQWQTHPQKNLLKRRVAMLSRNLATVHQPNLNRKSPRRRALSMSLAMRTRRRKLRIERVATRRQRMARTRMQAVAPPKPPRSEGAGREDEATPRSETRCFAKKTSSRSSQTHREKSTSSRCPVRSCRQDRIV